MNGLSIRGANLSDAKIILGWRNDKLARQMSLTSNEISEEEHLCWFNNKLCSVSNILLISEFCGQPCGFFMCAFDELEKCFFISINIASNFRLKGVGRWLLRNGIEQVKAKKMFPCYAIVKEENQISKNLFISSGFTQTGSLNGIITFQLGMDL